VLKFFYYNRRVSNFVTYRLGFWFIRLW